LDKSDLTRYNIDKYKETKARAGSSIWDTVYTHQKFSNTDMEVLDWIKYRKSSGSDVSLRSIISVHIKRLKKISIDRKIPIIAQYSIRTRRTRGRVKWIIELFRRYTRIHNKLNTILGTMNQNERNIHELDGSIMTPSIFSA
jgi:hypothetical protein